MKHQQVGVDFWAMGKAMATYGALTALCWLMLRLFNAAFTLPRRLRAQQTQIQDSLKELQRRFPDLNFTEEDLLNAEKDLDAFLKESEEEDRKRLEEKEKTGEGNGGDTETDTSCSDNRKDESEAKPKSDMPNEDKKTI